MVQPYAFHPTVAGYYLVGATTRLNLKWQDGGEHVVQIYKNGSPYANGSDLVLEIGINYGSTISTVVYLDGVTDYVQAYVFSNKTTTTASGGDAGREYSGFYGIFLNAGEVMLCDNGIPKMSAVPNFRAMQSRDQPVNAGAQLYQFNKVFSEFDNRCYNNSDQPRELHGRMVQPYAFLPTVAGYYLVGATTRMAWPCGMEHVVQIYKNGSPYANGSDINFGNGIGLNNYGSGINYGSTISTVVYLDGVADYVQAYVFADTTTTTASGGDAGREYSGFYGIFLNAGEVMLCDNGIPKMSAVPNFRAMQSRDQPVNAGAQLYQFNKVFSEFDNRCYNNSDQPRELHGRMVQPYAFHPTVAGYYVVGATTRLSQRKDEPCYDRPYNRQSSEGGEHVVQIYKNNKPYANGSDLYLEYGVNYGSTVSTVVYLDGVTDYVQAHVFSDKYTYTASGGDTGREYSGFYGIFLNSGQVMMCDNGIPKMSAVPSFRAMQSRDQSITPGATLYQFNKMFSDFDNYCYNNTRQPQDMRDRKLLYVEHPDAVIKDQLDMCRNMEIEEKDRVTGNWFRVAPSWGDLTKDSIVMMDDRLKLLVAVTFNSIKKFIRDEGPANLTWDRLLNLMNQNVMIERKITSDLNVDISKSREESNFFKGNGKPESAMRDEVIRWIRESIQDPELLAIIGEEALIKVANIYSESGAKVDSFTHFFSNGEVQDYSILDVGIIRTPDITKPYLQLFRIKISVHRQSQRSLFIQNDDSLLKLEANTREYIPREEVMRSIGAEVLDKAVVEMNKMFSEMFDFDL